MESRNKTFIFSKTTTRIQFTNLLRDLRFDNAAQR